MRNARTLAALSGLALMLSGCGSLLGGGRPAELYRFGSQPAGQAQGVEASAARPVTILYVGANFESVADTDRILTVTGSQAAYVAGARWIAPASDLFDGAIRQAFDHRTTAARIVRLRSVPLPDYALGIDVRRFEADYVGGAAAPPQIVIETRVRLMRWADRVVIAEWPVESREAAQENRIATIVDAFDRGTSTVVARIADLTQETLARTPPPALGAANPG
jgi:cholesterol transport system auxiliary component